MLVKEKTTKEEALPEKAEKKRKAASRAEKKPEPTVEAALTPAAASRPASRQPSPRARQQTAPREDPVTSTRKSERTAEQGLDDDALVERVEQIEEAVEDMVVKFDRSVAELDQFKKQFLSKATEKTIATYMRKICDGLQKECGDKPYKDKLSDPMLFQDLYQSEDSIALKDAVNEMFDKFQIIGMNLIQAKKFKKDA